jgi:uncharacterized GH25 family protein
MNYLPEYDEEPNRGLSRMIYGHELWIGTVERKNGKIRITADYGHHMNHDRGFPDYYGLIKIVRQDGTEITDFKTKDDGSTRCVLFDDPGDDIITVYCYSNPVPWTQTEEGWFKGPKKDFKNVKFAGGFNMCAKRVISKTGKPGDCNKMPFEIMPCCTRLSAGCKFRCRIHYEGKPVGEGIMCIAFRADAEDGIPVKTDKDGYAEFTLDRNGEYMILALHKDPTKSVEGEYDAESYESTYTVVVS